MLHARRIAFAHPVTGEEVRAEIAEDILELARKVGVQG